MNLGRGGKEARARPADRFHHHGGGGGTSLGQVARPCLASPRQLRLGRAPHALGQKEVDALRGKRRRRRPGRPRIFPMMVVLFLPNMGKRSAKSLRLRHKRSGHAMGIRGDAMSHVPSNGLFPPRPPTSVRACMPPGPPPRARARRR